MTRPIKLTPMLEQYFEIKRQAPDAIVFYRLGDFYEMFFEDAERAAPILDLVLTARGRGGESEAPMCGVPYHAADQYVARLIRHGFSVALCDQMGDAGAGKGIVRREITRIITPGTATEPSLVERDGCYLLSLFSGATGTGAAYLDTSTGDFFVRSYDSLVDVRLLDDRNRYVPREIIVPRSALEDFRAKLSAGGLLLSAADDSLFEPLEASRYLARHFGTVALLGFGLEEGDPSIAAAGAALSYAARSHRKDLTHITALRVEHDRGFLLIDSATLENLEVFESRDLSRARASLWNVLNVTRTAMGMRTLRKWMARPLGNRDAVFDRHDAVEELTRTRKVHEALVSRLSNIADLERLMSRISLGTAGPRECLSLADSLLVVQELKTILAELGGPLLRTTMARLNEVAEASGRIFQTIDSNPPQGLREGGVIRTGVHAELDELRSIARDSKTILLQIETAERTRTGIPSLKIRFNSVFGYYIEVSRANQSRVPPEYIRKQTLVNAERYITPELKELEEKIVGAEGKSIEIENRIYGDLLAELASQTTVVLQTATAVGELDVLACLAAVAVRHRYVRAQLVDDCEIVIEDGRHPVIEALSGEPFIPNSTHVRRDIDGMQLITGPNMGGKSTYLRQVALIVLLNQIGSFVPASSARLGLFDRIFTRVGAADHLARGESTFMVEMHETANILNHATDRSLIILDEVGRGTATFDGLSLAWAIVEFLHDSPSRRAITLFATHYHELTDLARTKTRVTNFSVAVKEWNDQIIFLRKVVPGAADKSYGIHVAKLAGIPDSVIQRARQILKTLEKKERDLIEETSEGLAGAIPTQLSLFQSREKEVLGRLRAMDVNSLSPVEALNALDDLRNRLLES